MGEQTFETEVLGSPTPVLVHFGAPWCGPCKLVEPLLVQLQSLSSEPVKLVEINADENLRLTSRYRITTLPTILLFKSGELLHRLEGLYRRETIMGELGQWVKLSA
jgi:thioredoxin 1